MRPWEGRHRSSDASRPTELDGLPHRVQSAVRGGPDDDGLDPAWNGSDIRGCRSPGDLGCVGIDGEDLEAALNQAVVDDIAAMASRRAGDRDDRNSLAGQKACRSLGQLHHDPHPSQSRLSTAVTPGGMN